MERESKSTPQPAAQTKTETAKAVEGQPQQFSSAGPIPAVVAAQSAPSAPTASEKAYDKPEQAAQETKLAGLNTKLTQIEQVLARPNPTRLVLEAVKADLAALEAIKDSLGDLSEEMSLLLQMYQDRMAKAFEMLSNMMKKSSETSSQIISNMK